MSIQSCAETQPLEKWFKGPPRQGRCSPCDLTGLAVEYEQVIRAEGQTAIADDFLKFLESDKITPASVAKRMDKIKALVPDTVGAKLRGLDCELQQNG